MERVWQVHLRHPQWPKTLAAKRRFDNPETALFYATHMVETPELWSEMESPALCKVIEAYDPEDIQIRIVAQD